MNIHQEKADINLKEWYQLVFEGMFIKLCAFVPSAFSLLMYCIKSYI